MIGSYVNFLQEKSAFPKIFTWEEGQDLNSSKILNSLHKSSVYEYLLMCLKMGLITKMVKSYHLSGLKQFEFWTKSGKYFKTDMHHTNSGYTFDHGWRENSGLKQDMENLVKNTSIKIDPELIINRPGYSVLIEELGLKDITSEEDIKRKNIVLEFNYVQTDREIKHDVKIKYLLNFSGEVKEKNEGYKSSYRTLLSKRNIQSYKDFDKSFDTIIREVKHRIDVYVNRQ